KKMTNDNLNKLLVFCVLFLRQKTSIVHGAQALETKVTLLLHAEPENPKCFAEGMSDLTCFWEEDEERAGFTDQYSFIYTYQNENSSECSITALPAAGGKRLYFCRLSQTQLFVPFDIRGMQGQLKASWLPPSLKYMGDSMMYEVSYTMAGSHIGKVEEVQASSELILRGLQSGTKYKVRIRVKLDGISYSGHWSTWTDPVLMEQCLVVISSSLILTLLSLLVLMSHRRFLLKKIWPIIPTPESKFQGLFKVYGGDFQVRQINPHWRLMVEANLLLLRGIPAPLEVLSEVSLWSRLTQLRFAAQGLRGTWQEEDEDKKLKRGGSCIDGGVERNPLVALRRWTSPAIHQHPAPWTQSSLLESHDALCHPQCSEPQFSLPLEGHPLNLDQTWAPSTGSGIGPPLVPVQFEYPNHTWPPKGPGYTYMAVADSGVSMDYSPMSSSKIDDIGKGVIYTNEYKNEIPAHRRPHRYAHPLCILN
uniref:Fibronectin type-III domain-containing protein n=1 Tax=Oncorhynchus tshawytscha TaxID=74940 RepID=A0AAZ3NQ58_ONCTS